MILVIYRAIPGDKITCTCRTVYVLQSADESLAIRDENVRRYPQAAIVSAVFGPFGHNMTYRDAMGWS
jgi:hypothetical protein